MTWLLLTTIAAFIAASINYIDKFLVDRFTKNSGIGALVIISSLIGIPAAITIFLLQPHVISINPFQAFLIVVNGMIYISWLIPYCTALSMDDTSSVTPLFLLSPLFALILSFIILHETITPSQALGAALIIAGAFGITLNITSHRLPHIKLPILSLMTLTSFLIAISIVMFKFFSLEQDFFTIAFWEFVGFSLSAFLIFVTVPSYRRQFLHFVSTNSPAILLLNGANEVLAVAYKLLINFTSLLAPVSLVVFVAEGFQPIFVVALGITLTLLAPSHFHETITKSTLAQKIISITLLVFGTGFIYS